MSNRKRRERNAHAQPTHRQAQPTNFAYLALALAACAALVIPSAASAASSGGAVVFSRVVTTTVTETVKDAEGNPSKTKTAKR